jgi:hypothetical protein
MIIFSIIAGYLIWITSEYIWHRFILHNHKTSGKVKKWLAYDHINHHKNPKEKAGLFLPVKLTFPISLVLFSFAWLLFSFPIASFFYFGILFGYILYEAFHFSAHHGTGNSKFLKWMRGYHLKHHFKEPRCHYMVSNPILDILFTTY